MLWIRLPSICVWRCFRGRSFGEHKAAVKMHTLLDLHGNIPTFIRVTDGKVHDVNILDEIMPEAGAFYVMDRGYIDFERLFVLHAQLGLLRGAHQVERLAPAALLASGGQEHRRALGSDRHSDVLRVGLGVSGLAAARELLRRRDQQAIEVPDQQLHASGADHRSASTSSAGRWNCSSRARHGALLRMLWNFKGQLR